MMGPGTDWPGVILKSHDSSATPADVNNIVICLPRMPMCDLFGNCGKRLRGCGPCLVETWWASAVSSVACAVALYLRLSFLCSDATVWVRHAWSCASMRRQMYMRAPRDGGAEYQPWGEGLAPLLALQKDGQRFVTSSRSSVQFGTLVVFLRLVVLMHADCENGCERKLLTLV